MFGSWESLQIAGLAANRPTTMNPPQGVFMEYYATDTGETSRWYYGASGWSSSSGSAPVANTGVTVSGNANVAVKHTTLTLANFAIAVPNANDYGGAKLCDLPASNLMVLSAELNLTTVKGGVTNGLVAATDIAVSVGTAAASNTTLNGTMANVVASQSITADQLSNALQVHTLATTPAPVGILDGAPTAALYLNTSAAGGITADDTLTVSGTIDLYWIDLGNVTSPS